MGVILFLFNRLPGEVSHITLDVLASRFFLINTVASKHIGRAAYATTAFV
jgi:hypothetical protein